MSRFSEDKINFMNKKGILMKSAIRIMLMLLFSFSTFNVVFAETDVEGSKDHPLLTRMPGFYISEYTATDFDSHEFNVYNKAKDTWEGIRVEGRKTDIRYFLKKGSKAPSALQITRNYTNALTRIGGKILRQDNEMAIMKAAKDGKEIWVEIWAGSDDYSLTIVEKAALVQEVASSDMLDALNKEGHIALYINFDTGKSIIKPESQSIIDQIVQMMKQNPGLKIGIEGHTDNVGNSKSNKTLSEERAKSVVSAIVKQGVDAKRLSATGFGQDKPIADNKTEEGRAKNRRVELVKK